MAKVIMEDYLTYLDLDDIYDDAGPSIGAVGGTQSSIHLGKRAQMIRENTLLKWSSKYLSRPVQHTSEFCDGHVLHELITKLFPVEYTSFISKYKKTAGQKMGKLLKNMRHKDTDSEENLSRERIKTCVRFIRTIRPIQDEKKVVNGIELGSNIILDVLAHLSEGFHLTNLQAHYVTRYDQKLLIWLNEHLPKGRTANNCDTDWRNGIRLGALLNNFNPDLCPDYGSWDPDNEVGNLAIALGVAQSHLEGVNQILDATDFHYVGTPPQCIHMYLSQFLTGKIRLGCQYVRMSDVKSQGRGQRHIPVEEEPIYLDTDAAGYDSPKEKYKSRTARKLPSPPLPKRNNERPPPPVPHDTVPRVPRMNSDQPAKSDKITELPRRPKAPDKIPALPRPKPPDANQLRKETWVPQPPKQSMPKLPAPKRLMPKFPVVKDDDTENTDYLDVMNWDDDDIYDEEEIYEAPENSVPSLSPPPVPTKGTLVLLEIKPQVPVADTTPAAVFIPCDVKPLATDKFLSELRATQTKLLKSVHTCEDITPEEENGKLKKSIDHVDVRPKATNTPVSTPSDIQHVHVPKPKPRPSIKRCKKKSDKNVADVNSNSIGIIPRFASLADDYEPMTTDSEDQDYMEPDLDNIQEVAGSSSSPQDTSSINEDNQDEYDYADDRQISLTMTVPASLTTPSSRPQISQPLMSRSDSMESHPEMSQPCQDVSSDMKPSPIAQDFCNLISTYDERSREKLKRAYKHNSRLELSKILQVQEGHFSEVYKGRYTDPDKGVQMVAVKIAKGKSRADNLVNEALLMMEFKHENVMALYGFTVKDEKPNLLLPWMENGDVLTFIRKRTKTITLKRLLTLSMDVLKGMIYLSDAGYIHRDLAARNCLVDRKLRVKISDLTLARDVFHEEYLQESNMGTSYRWTSIEALRTKKYTIASDVWSFGVLWWELLTCGDVPYKELKDAAQMAFFLYDGHRLEKPERADRLMYQYMTRCWSVDPDERPSFPELQEFVEDKLAEMDPEYITRIDSPYAFSPYREVH